MASRRQAARTEDCAAQSLLLVNPVTVRTRDQHAITHHHPHRPSLPDSMQCHGREPPAAPKPICAPAACWAVLTRTTQSGTQAPLITGRPCVPSACTQMPVYVAIAHLCARPADACGRGGNNGSGQCKCMPVCARALTHQPPTHIGCAAQV